MENVEAIKLVQSGKELSFVEIQERSKLCRDSRRLGCI